METLSFESKVEALLTLLKKVALGEKSPDELQQAYDSFLSLETFVPPHYLKYAGTRLERFFAAARRLLENNFEDKNYGRSLVRLHTEWATVRRLAGRADLNDSLTGIAYVIFSISDTDSRIPAILSRAVLELRREIQESLPDETTRSGIRCEKTERLIKNRKEALEGLENLEILVKKSPFPPDEEQVLRLKAAALAFYLHHVFEL